MPTSQLNPRVDFYFAKAGQWQEALETLRTYMLDCPLTEELKWGVPCYTFEQHNVVLLQAFKEYCAVLFVKGALLPDSKGLLIQQTANTQAHRQLRFTSVPEITAQEAVIKAYVLDAVEVEKAGRKVVFQQNAQPELPAEFWRKAAETPALKAAFAALTPGRQRAYALHFSEPKQAKTREARVAKWVPHILSGKGLQD